MKYLNALFLVLFCLVSSIVFCADKNINLPPVNVQGKNIGVVGVAKIDSTVSADAIVGRHRREDSAVFMGGGGQLVAGGVEKSKNLSGNQIFNENIVKDYKMKMIEELKSAGYSCSESAKPSLFDEAETKDNSRFQIGAIIQKCNVRTFQDDLMGNDITQCHMEEVEWQVFDRSAKKVVFTAKTSGWDRKKGTVVQQASVAAFRKAFRNFLADKELARVLEAESKK